MSLNWKTMSLDEVIVKRNQGVNTTTEKVEYSETGVKVIRANNISTGIIDYSNCVYVAGKTFERIKDACKPQKGDILYTNIGSQLGNAALVNTDENFVIAWNVLRLQPSNKINADFLVYLLNNPSNKKMIQSLNSSSTMPFVSGGEIGKVEFSFPDLNKQAEIAKILKSLDEKIHLNNQINQTLESIAQAIFKSWFIDFDPVRAKIAAKQEGKDSDLAAMCAISGKSETELEQMAKEDFAELQATAALFPDELVESELGEVPKGWGLQSLYDTAEFVNGAAFKAKDFSSNTKGLPIIKIAELKQGLSAQTKYTNSSFDKKYKVSSGDIFYSWSGSPETSLDVFKWFGGDGWLNQHIFKINTKSKGQTYFVYYLLKYLKPTLIRLATNKQTTGLGHITVADMKALKVIKPEGNLFLNFARIIAPLYEKESLLKQESIDLGLLRDNLLPKLLSGEIDISVMNREQI